MKKIMFIVIVLAVFKFCFIIDEGLELENNIHDVDLYSNIKANVKKRNEFLTVDKTNQRVLREKHISKYDPSERIIEPIGDLK